MVPGSPDFCLLVSYSSFLTYNKDEFRSTLDETVIIAIVGDYDLTTHFDEARGILEALSKDAVAEDACGFNPAGLDGHLDDLAGLETEWPSQTDSCNSASGSKLFTDISERTDFSDALSERFEALDLPNDVNISTLDEDGKVGELKIMFPRLRELDLKFALKKAGGDFTKTCDELLNTQYLEENGLRPKGIEGAFREDDHVGPRKGKKILSARRSPNLGLVSSPSPINSLRSDVIVIYPGHCLTPSRSPQRRHCQGEGRQS